MSLNIQPAAPGAVPSRPGTLPAGVALPSAGLATGGRGDQAAFSTVAVLLAQLQTDAKTTPALPPAGSETARALTALLAQRLGAMLQSTGLPMNPAVAFDVDVANRVVVTSSRPDAAQIQVLVDNNADIQDLVRVLQTINHPTTAGRALLAQRVGTLLQANGLPLNPAITFDVDANNRVVVTSARPDVAQIQRLVDNNADIRDLVRLLQTINHPTTTGLAALALATARPSDAEGTIADSEPSTHTPLFHPWGWSGAAGRRRSTGIPSLRGWRGWLVAAVIGASLFWWLR